MTNAERKNSLIQIIRETEDKLCILKYADSESSILDIETEIDNNQAKLRTAITHLIDLVEQETQRED